MNNQQTKAIKAAGQALASMMMTNAEHVALKKKEDAAWKVYMKRRA
jgi:hypothetical protein